MAIDDVLGQRVDCSWNLHKKRYSIRRNGKVVGYATCVSMIDVAFVINERLLRQFHRTGVRTVHAWLRGTLVAVDAASDSTPIAGSETVLCNPFKYDRFVRERDAAPVLAAGQVTLHRDRRIEAANVKRADEHPGERQ